MHVLASHGLRLAAIVALLLAPAAARAGELIFEDGFETGDIEAWVPDETQLRTLIAGPPPVPAQVVAALETIGNSLGLPVRTLADTFIFAAECGTETWSLVGDFNAWTPQVMLRTGALCYLERPVASPLEAKYQFVDGAAAFIADPRSRRYTYDDAEELSLVRSALGHIQRWFGFGPQDGLLPRHLRVWVPAGQIFDRVLYVHDGQNVFDPNAFFGGLQLQETLPEGVLAVAIDNTADRLAEYTHVSDDLGGGPIGGAGDDYADFVRHTVRPFIEQRYGSVSMQGLLGTSLGGLISLHIAHRFPGDFAFTASLSGTLGWGSIGGGIHNETIIERYAGSGHGTTSIYIDSGGGGTCIDSDADGLEDDGAMTDNYCLSLQMKNVLVSEGYILGSDLWYVWEPGAPSNEAAWAARLPVPLQHFGDL